MGEVTLWAIQLGHVGVPTDQTAGSPSNLDISPLSGPLCGGGNVQRKRRGLMSQHLRELSGRRKLTGRVCPVVLVL